MSEKPIFEPGVTVLHSQDASERFGFDQIEKRVMELNLEIPLLREVIVTDKVKEGEQGIQRLRHYDIHTDSFDPTETKWFRYWVHPLDYARLKGAFTVTPLSLPIPLVMVPVVHDNREVPSYVQIERRWSPNEDTKDGPSEFLFG